MRLPLLLFLLLPFVNTTLAQPKPKARYDYLLYIPNDYARSTEPYPLLIYLHGGSHRGNDLSKLNEYGPPRLISQGRTFPFIVISPQCPDGKYWSTENWFDSLYHELTSRYRIDTTRVYLTGVSMGGYGTYITALDHPNQFAAIVPLCGGINDRDTSRACLLRNTPIWAFHGTADDLISIRETERIDALLRRCKGRMKFSRLKNEGHDLTYLYERKPRLYRWLLKHKRASPLPRTVFLQTDLKQ